MGTNVVRALHPNNSFHPVTIKHILCKYAGYSVGLFMNISPSMSLVDNRLAGEGTGKALGINDPILGWVIISVFTLVWALYYTSTKELGGQSEEVRFHTIVANFSFI